MVACKKKKMNGIHRLLEPVDDCVTVVLNGVIENRGAKKATDFLSDWKNPQKPIEEEIKFSF